MALRPTRIPPGPGQESVWDYPRPPRVERAMDGCFVDDERVESNDGDFYGGWITSAVVGPFKGAPGTGHW
jgi:hypothetical protein